VWCADAQREFEENGIVRLPGALPREHADRMADAVWRFLERKTGAQRDDPTTWATSWNGQPAVSFKSLKRHGVFTTLMNDSVNGALDGVFGADGWKKPNPGGQILVTYPNAPEWSLPLSLWHMDGGFGQATWPTFGVKLFALLADHEPGGGATLAIAGSHRLVEQYTPALRETQHGGGKERWNRFMRETGLRDEIDRGDMTRVVEMTGNAGDVYVMHLHTFHCIAPNASTRPRMMLGKAVLAAEKPCVGVR
jgi:hypothetical protein